MRRNLKIVSPFIVYCFAIFLFYFDNLFKISDYKELFEIVGMSLFAGFFEELIFRRWLQRSISKKLEKKNKKPVYAVFIVACLFGLLHMTNLIGNETTTFYKVLMQSLSALGGGLLLGAIYFKTKNYLLTSGVHAFYDFVILLSSSYCVTCSINSNLELILQIIFNIFMALFLLKDELFFDGHNNLNKNSKITKIIYIIIYILILGLMILLWRK